MSLPPVEVPSGAMRFNSDSQKLEYWDGSQWLEVSTFSPNLDGGARGLFGGGYVSPLTGNNTIDYINISSTGNALDFGDLLTGSSVYYNASFSSSTRGVWAAGALGPAFINIVSYVTISSTGNAQDFGDTSTLNHSLAGCSNSTRGLVGGGYPSPANSDINTIEYVTIASTGNFVDFGDLTQIRRALSSTSNSTRGLWGGGIYTTPAPTSVNSNIIDYVTISSLGNAQDFGDLSVSRVNVSACANSTRGLFGGGNNPGVLNSIDYVTIASLGNAVNFGTSSTSALFQTAALSSSTRGVFGGRTSPAVLNTIDYVTILTQGNAVDFGDLTVARGNMSACSNAHGGL